MNKKPKIGIAFGGGGTRAGANIGALEVLEQNNIKIDMVSGTSAGSAAAALYAHPSLPEAGSDNLTPVPVSVCRHPVPCQAPVPDRYLTSLLLHRPFPETPHLSFHTYFRNTTAADLLSLLSKES